jgi:alkanesulfonate monooxygenase SsuD/methylene tetrahydromethanopterin reductase-like flavin-dependent oxidoreductase (luciferase family)
MWATLEERSLAVRLSLNITNFSPSEDLAGLGAWLGRVARAADESGLDTLWVSDHLLQADPNSNLGAEMLEAYTTLGFLASQTERIRLGAMVTAGQARGAASFATLGSCVYL